MSYSDWGQRHLIAGRKYAVRAWDEALHPRAPGGKFGEKPGEDRAAAVQAITSIAARETGGFTARPTGILRPTTGFVISEHPNLGHTKEISPTEITNEEDLEQMVSEFVDKNLDYVLEDPSRHFGGWKNDQGIQFLDVSIVHTGITDNQAREIGQKNNQQAIYHIDSQKTIPTGGTGRA